MAVLHHLWGMFVRIYSWVFDLLGLGPLVDIVFRAVVSKLCSSNTLAHTTAAPTDEMRPIGVSRVHLCADVVCGAGRRARLLPQALHQVAVEDQAPVGGSGSGAASLQNDPDSFCYKYGLASMGGMPLPQSSRALQNYIGTLSCILNAQQWQHALAATKLQPAPYSSAAAS